MVRTINILKILFVLIVSIAIGIQLVEFFLFKNAGPRFTAVHGQELCEALVVVAKESIGFKASGKPLPDCNYEGKKPKP